MARQIPTAEIVKEFPTMGRESIYPWDEWTDGKIRKLVKGTHFSTSIKTMRQTCNKQAVKLNLKFKSRAGKDGTKEVLFVQFLKR